MSVPYRTDGGGFMCRRSGNDRRKLNPVAAVCWTEERAPVKVSIIEADTKGARLIFPFPLQKGEQIKVSFSNKLGLHRTETARVAWVQVLATGSSIAGLAFESLSVAA